MNLTYKKTVLVVEDSGFDRDMLTLFLHEKYNVITAENGLIAEQILESGQEVSVILLDIAMPVINGFDFLTWIQSKSEYRHIPIVFTSIAATNENILKGLQMGVRDVIFKPYDWGRVERCVENLLTLAQYQRSYTETDIAAYEKDT
ncbi:MAG: response regulator, partial [Firmicutes bacterium]|nr:response regulator [Bacillota bacterium]